ncbi:MAG TPA: arylsulfatase [Gemmataceae bacterium]|nr:arylsulfatase [Gemmataceae bacterium]
MYGIRFCAASAGLCLLMMPVEGPAQSPAPKPNLVVILADDLGFSDIGCYGGEIQTPNVDKLAADGLRFTQFYNTARCWPSRAALLTGYYAQQVNRDPPGRRPKWAALLPELLRSAGYHSYHSGKWHLDGPVRKGGFERSYLVVDQDRHFGPRNHQLDDVPLPQPKPEDHYYSTTAIAQHAIDWLAEHQAKHRSEPFFLYLAFTCPHFPLQAPPEDIARYRGRFRDGWDMLRQRRLERMRELGIVDCSLSERTPGVPAWDSLDATQKDDWEWHMAIHAAMVDRMDREIGRVLEQLHKTGSWDNTLILFCSDNGASAERLVRGDGHDPVAPPGSARTFLCLEPPWANLANAPLRKSKIFTHEGGISTPLIVHWPTRVKAHSELRHTPGHFVDFVPTLLELAGVSAPATWNGVPRPVLPGRSLVPAFAKDVTIPHDFLYFHHQTNRALRVGDWKIVASGADTPWELYDLAKDRSETHNLAGRYPDRVKELAAVWMEHDKEFRKQGATGGAVPPQKQQSSSQRQAAGLTSP